MAGELYINGTSYQDLNANGLRDEGEAGLAERTVRLSMNGSELANITTDQAGSYAFYNLSPGSYQVSEDLVLGWNQTGPASGNLRVTLTDKPAHRMDFGSISSEQLSQIAAAPPELKYPIMRPTPEQARSWMEEYRTAPTVYLSPDIKAQLSQADEEDGEVYDLLSYLDYDPSERNQGRCGNCWVWAGTGAMEIANSQQTYILDRLSIQYLNSNFRGGSGNNWACCGGWLSDVASFYQSEGIAVPWSNANAHWQDGGRTCEQGSTSVPSSAISTQPNYPLTSIVSETIPTQGTGKETAIANIKNVLHQERGVFFAFFLPTDSDWDNFYNFWNNQPEEAVWQPDLACGKPYNYNEGGGHAVLCVGYDDTDPLNRYWIMLNSWGDSSLRPNGLFLVNMDMNYDCSYSGLGYAFSWMALNMRYSEEENYPPDTPYMPDGPSEGLCNHLISFTTSSIDPDGDRIKYLFDWGDGSTTETGYESSSVCASASHAWSEPGEYQVQVRATDSRGAQSEWSPSSAITITGSTNPPNRPSIPSGPESGYVGNSYSYTSSATDPDGDSVKLTFDWGDGDTSDTGLVPSGSSVSASHAWNLPGSYQVTAQATDSEGYSSAWSDFLTVQINENNPPDTPSAPSGPESGQVGISYAYSTSATDPNLDRVKYTFDWGDQTTSETEIVSSGTAAGASHVWSQSGAYQVKAKATDEKGLSSGWSPASIVNIAAPNRPPNTPTAPSGPTAVYTWSDCSYSTSASDPDSDPVKYIFDWGDGESSETGLAPSGTAQSLSYHWSRAGTYYVRAQAVDDMGASSEWSSPVSVKVSLNNLPRNPASPSGPISGFTGTSYSYSASTSDPDRDRLIYSFDWGDGTSSEIGPVRSGLRTTASHTWSNAGTYKLRVKATDSKGGSSDWSSPLSVAIVANSPPLSPALPSGPAAGRTRVYYSYSASTSDPDGDRVKYTFNWGDGTTTQSGLLPSGSQTAVSHRWLRAGTYSVKVMASDSRGASSEWSPSLVVVISNTFNNPPHLPAAPKGAEKGYKGRSYYYSATSSDPEGDAVKFVFDWGDGTTTESWPIRAGTTASIRHLWKEPGTYQVRVEAKDLKGASSGWSDPRSVQIV